MRDFILKRKAQLVSKRTIATDFLKSCVEVSESPSMMTSLMDKLKEIDAQLSIIEDMEMHIDDLTRLDTLNHKFSVEVKEGKIEEPKQETVPLT
jgi:hypothetical protein